MPHAAPVVRSGLGIPKITKDWAYALSGKKRRSEFGCRTRGKFWRRSKPCTINIVTWLTTQRVYSCSKPEPSLSSNSHRRLSWLLNLNPHPPTPMLHLAALLASKTNQKLSPSLSLKRPPSNHAPRRQRRMRRRKSQQVTMPLDLPNLAARRERLRTPRRANLPRRRYVVAHNPFDIFDLRGFSKDQACF